MAKTSVSPGAARGLVLNLDQIAEHIDNGRLNEALGLIRFARARAELAVKPERSTAPMDVINDVACYIDQLLGIADLLTSVEREDLIDGTLARVGYAIEGILERARDRLGEAREVPRG